MALSAQAQNWVTDAMSLADTMLDVQDRNGKLRARATVNALANVINDADLLLLPSLSHLTKTELTDAVTVFSDFVVWLGDENDPASRAGKLLKLRG